MSHSPLHKPPLVTSFAVWIITFSLKKPTFGEQGLFTTHFKNRKWIQRTQNTLKQPCLTRCNVLGMYRWHGSQAVTRKQLQMCPFCAIFDIFPINIGPKSSSERKGFLIICLQTGEIICRPRAISKFWAMVCQKEASKNLPFTFGFGLTPSLFWRHPCSFAVNLDCFKNYYYEPLCAPWSQGFWWATAIA